MIKSKEDLLKEYKGNWVSVENTEDTLEITDKEAIDENGRADELSWRPDLERWVITGISIYILSIEDGKLMLDVPKENLYSGRRVFVRPS